MVNQGRIRDQPFILGDVVTNAELAGGRPRAPDYQAETEAMNSLAETLAHPPQDILQKLVEVAQELAVLIVPESVCSRSTAAKRCLGGSSSWSLARHDLVDSIDRESKLQEQLQHSRTIGMPAVAIAHDFNNLLHVSRATPQVMASISAIQRHWRKILR
jgi:hypothetical protein